MATFTINSDALITTPITFTFPVANTSNSARFTLGVNGVTQYDIDWGDGTVDTITNTFGVHSHTYASPYTGDISVTFLGTLDDIVSFGDGTNNSSSNAEFNFPLSFLGQLNNLETFNAYSSPMTGDVGDLPPNLTRLLVQGSTNTITGDLTMVNPLIEQIFIYGNNTVSGDLTGQFSALTLLQVLGNNTLTGTLDAMTSLGQLFITGSNTIGGLIQNVSNTITDFRLQGNNVIGGDYSLANFPNLLIFIVDGINTMTGDISLPSVTMASNNFQVRGNNTFSGILENIPIPSSSIIVTGANTITGNLNNINDTNGNLNLASISIIGNNTVVGNFTGLQKVTNVDLGVNLGMQGDIGLMDLTTLAPQIGSPQIGVVLPNLTASVNGPLTYTTKDWSVTDPTQNIFFRLNLNAASNPGDVLTPTELDQLIIDLDNSSFKRELSPGSPTTSRLQLSGGFSRTTASDAAFNQLVADGMFMSIS